MNDRQAKLLVAIVVLTLGLVPHAMAAEAMVSLGADGKLKYAQDARENRIPDFSRAGYMGGGVKLPDLPVKATLEPRPGMKVELQWYSAEAAGKGDDTERVQGAIDKVSAMPLGRNGFRGAILLKRGIYRVAGTLNIKASGVVLRGEGQGKNGTIILGTGTKKRTLIVVSKGSKITEVPGSRRKLTDSYVPWGTKTLKLESTRGYSVGAKVMVHRVCTQNWLDHIGMSKVRSTPWTTKSYQFYFERVVTAVKGNSITIDAPTVNAMEDKYGGGFVYLYKEEGGISQVGIEHLRIVSEYRKKNDEEHVWTGVGLYNVTNAWARNITAVHVGWGGVTVSGGGKFITVQDCSYLKPVSICKGGRRYPYQASGQFCFVQRCYSEGGRHCNVAGPRSRGPNVYLDCHNKDGDSGPHHRWAMGALYDNVKTGSLCARNRGNSGTGHGWTGAQIVFWNCEARGMRIQRPPTAELYLIGCKAKGGTEGAHFESHGKPVLPRSLYLKQLEERLGKKAVENVTTEAQRKGRIFDQLRKELAQ